MKPLDQFLSRLNPLAPGCPQPMAAQALLDAAIEFCDASMVVRYITAPAPAQEGVGSYDIDLPSQQVLSRVLTAWYGGRPLTLAPRQTVLGYAAYHAGMPGRPRWAFVNDDGAITLMPTPDDKHLADVVLQIATRPARTATMVDDALFDDWAEAIVGGALARLAVIPGTPFNSPELASLGQARFARGLSDATLEARKGNVVGDVAVRMITATGRHWGARL
jgi:hypothetical protein